MKTWMMPKKLFVSLIVIDSTEGALFAQAPRLEVLSIFEKIP